MKKRVVYYNSRAKDVIYVCTQNVLMLFNIFSTDADINYI